MISEFKKSVDGILSERLASPLYGTFIVSWLLWNWKIIYLTLFINKDEITGTKIDFIVKNYSNHWDLITLPAISTLILLTIMPFLTIGAYWLQLWFNDKRLIIKNKIEKNQVLTIQQSNAIRKEIRESEKLLNDLVIKKDETIKYLQDEIDALKNEIEDISIKNRKLAEVTNKSSEPNKPWEMPDSTAQDVDFELLKNNRIAYDNYLETAKSISNTNEVPMNLDRNILEFYIVNGYVARSKSYKEYSLTEKGKIVYKKMFNDTFSNQKIPD